MNNPYEILGVSEGSREDKEAWSSFLRHLKGRGLKGVRLIISDKNLGLYDVIGDFFPRRNGSAALSTGTGTPLQSARGSMPGKSLQC